MTDTTRLEAFSDGVFAIAITLLILEIKVPQTGEIAASGLWTVLASRWPSYLGYVISFLTIGIMWANHHALFTYIRRTDRPFILANLFLLMMVAFLPFSTGVLAEHLPEPDSRVPAAVFYGMTLVLIAIGFNGVWLYGIRGRRLLGPDIDEEGVRTITSRYRLGPIGYLAATGTAFVNVWLSLAIHTALALLFAKSERQDTAV
jgi:uncharacterized membrane protein